MAEKKPRKPMPHEQENWTGYTLDELRYMRAYSAARIEINRERLAARVKTVEKNGLGGSPRNMLGKVLGAFSYIDLGIIAWRIGSKVFQATRLLKK